MSFQEELKPKDVWGYCDYWFCAAKPPPHSLPHNICEVLDNYSLHLLFCPTVTMHNGRNCVLISNAGILICWRLSDSLLCFCDQNLNWFNCWITATIFSLRATILHVFPQLGTSWKREFQRPQGSDLSRAHGLHHVRLHVLVHMSRPRCRKRVYVCSRVHVCEGVRFMFMHEELCP